MAMIKEFLKGWRRKAGLIALVFALLFIGGLARTLKMSDQIGFKIGNHHHLLTSKNGFLRWTTYSRYSIQRYHWVTPLWESRPVGAPQELGHQMEGAMVDWDWHWKAIGFDFGRGSLNKQDRFGVWAVPYWLGIILTGFAAHLLILSPPPKKPRETIEAPCLMQV